MSRDEFGLQLKYILFSIFIFISTNAFADAGVVVSNEFPSDKLMLENHIYKNAAFFENLGVYSGTINAIAIYENTPSFCDAGYYLPENTNECVMCDENHYCVGGENAIKQKCPDSLVAPIGAKTSGECGRIMHMGDDIIYLTRDKQTTPALAVQIGNDVYYAKMAPVNDGVKPMNKNTANSFKTELHDIEYYIYDNTIADD